MTAYFILKYLHLMGASVLLGTGAGIAFFMLVAHRMGNTATVAAVARIVPLSVVPPVLLMKLTMAPGVFEPKSADAPPRTTSIRSMFSSGRNRLSAFMKYVCIVGKTGSPSSMNITYSTPRMPRIEMCCFTSPPELSTRVKPGT